MMPSYKTVTLKYDFLKYAQLFSDKKIIIMYLNCILKCVNSIGLGLGSSQNDQVNSKWKLKEI